MPKLVAFLRAINVGGHTVSMAALRAEFEALGLKDVETFIASGNVIFTAPTGNRAALERKIESHLHGALGYEVKTFLRTRAGSGRPSPLTSHSATQGFARRRR